MEYKDLTQEQKILRQKIWDKLLDNYCPSLKCEDEDGEEEDYGKPCDMGSLCDKCHHDHQLKQNYLKELAKEELLLSSETLEIK